MSNILVLSSLGKITESARYEAKLNKLIEDGEVWELNTLSEAVKKDVEKYKDL